ncbi:MAG: hypothetical protein AAFZ15_34250 [Bacteroidota bacterium]
MIRSFKTSIGILFGLSLIFIQCTEDQMMEPVINKTVFVTDNITVDTTWSAGYDYILDGGIIVENGACLTIEPGTVIKGKPEEGANASYLLVARGGSLKANGTEQAPIIFTSTSDEITSEMVLNGTTVSPNLDPNADFGLWGGVIVLGNAPISFSPGFEPQIAYLPLSDLNGRYGGNNPDDSSGSLTYVSIRHSGINVGSVEFEGLILGGVGSSTVLDNIEVVANQDDGIEWLGGTCSASNILVWGSGDDGLDTDQGWNGSCMNWIVLEPRSGSALELDGPEGPFEQGCNSFIDGTIYAGPNIDHIIDWDPNSNSAVVNLYIFGVDELYEAGNGIESFGGNGNCAIGSWEYTLPQGYDDASILADIITAGEAVEVSKNNNTVGADVTVFGWTLTSQTGKLAEIGLK